MNLVLARLPFFKEGRFGWFERINLCVRVGRFQSFADPGQGTTSSDPGNEGIRELLGPKGIDNFLPRGGFVNCGVSWVFKLHRHEVALGLDQFFRFRNRPLHPVSPGRQD